MLPDLSATVAGVRKMPMPMTRLMTIIVRSNSLSAGFVSLLGESIFSSILFSNQSKRDKTDYDHREVEEPESGFCFFTWREHVYSFCFQIEPIRTKLSAIIVRSKSLRAGSASFVSVVRVSVDI